jgi:hypothetical protein
LPTFIYGLHLAISPTQGTKFNDGSSAYKRHSIACANEDDDDDDDDDDDNDDDDDDAALAAVSVPRCKRVSF